MRCICILITLALLHAAAGVRAEYQSKSIARERIPPTPYGLKIVRSDDVAVVSPQPQVPLTVQPVQDYLGSIEAAEVGGGAYSANLAEPLFGLGRAYQAADQHPEAMLMFKRALHLSRINDGLYSAGQLPLLQSMIDSQVALGQFTEADKNRFYRYRVQQQVYAAGDPALAQATTEYSDWQREAYLDGLGEQTYRRLLDIHDMHSRQIERLQATNKTDPMLIPYLYQRLRGEYLVSQYEGEKEAEFQVNISAHAAARPAGNINYHSERFRMLQENNFRNGRKALQQIVTVLEAQQPRDNEALARAKIATGDWYLWWQRPARAHQNYEQAYLLLEPRGTAGSGSRGLFEEVRELPVERIFHPGAISAEQPARQARAVVQLDVSRLGRAQRIQIMELEPRDAMGARVALFEMLREVVFRPLIRNGEVVAATAIQREYNFEY